MTVLFMTIFADTGIAIVNAEEQIEQTGSVSVQISKNQDAALEAGEAHEVHVRCTSTMASEAIVKLYLKNQDDTAALDVTVPNLLKAEEVTDPETQKTIQETLEQAVTLPGGNQAPLEAQWMQDTDDAGNITARYLQAVVPAGVNVEFEMKLQYELPEETIGTYEKVVKVEGYAYADGQDVTQTSDDETRDNSETVSWNGGAEEANVENQVMTLAADTGTEVVMYFAAPTDWTNKNYTIKANAKLQSAANDWKQKDMSDTGQTYEGMKVYTVTYTSSECPYDGFATLQFQAYDGSTWKDQKVVFDAWTLANVFNGKLYTGTGWVDYTSFDPNNHTTFSGKTIYFENKGSTDVSQGVHAVFYEKNTEGSLQQVSKSTMTAVTSKRFSVTIPTASCSYIQFTDTSGTVLGDTYSNFYGQGEREDGVESFVYDENSRYCYRYISNGDDSTWGTLGGITVYYDATLSKLPYTGDDGAKNSGKGSIPSVDGNGNVYYYATGDGKTPISGQMEKTPQDNYEDVYKTDLPEGYTKIRFAGYSVSNENASENADATDMSDIPINLSKPCFYGDSSDDVIYKGGNRGGYWDEAYTVRDVQKGKGTDIVDIKSSEFTKENNVLYVNSTFYDYYSDYELNGNNRDSYSGSNGGSQRNWVTFRQFDQALSDTYKNNQVSIPIYTGHFQPDWSNWGNRFSTISDTLGLYGYSKSNQNPFMSTNNSTMDINGNGEKYDYAAWGLVSPSLVNGRLMTSDNKIAEPHFDEDFLMGNNSKNTVLGEVYHNVAFPFTKKDIDNNGVQYWYFDSAETTLAMRQDTNTNNYYLQNVGNQGWSQNVNSTGTTSGDKVSNQYGFFPFNETSTATSGKNYNYGFGTKLEFTFRLTDDGTVLSNNNTKVPITFSFSGDDDVWVFIDGKLALDVGGAHGRVDGTLNFKDKKATVNKVKASAGSKREGTNVDSPFSLTGSNTDEHTLTMFYMERGMWESNMKISFNFPDENQLEVEKQVDKTNVNEIFSEIFDKQSLFTFSIKNLATHFGSKMVSSTEKVNPIAIDLSNVTTTPADGNVFSYNGNNGDKSGIHWYAGLNDTAGTYRDKRMGTITLRDSIDISKMAYLEFKFYYDYDDLPTLNNMYLQIVDENTKVKGNVDDYLSGKTYGTVALGSKQWVTVKIDLSKMPAQSGFDATKVKYIKFGYNYPQDFYLKDFTFIPSAEASGLTGFVTKQYDIPDYGSAESGKLEVPTGATYTSSNGNNYIIGSDGTFALENNETILFRDQFRRGSYIYLEELAPSDAFKKLFNTSWTMYENGQAVTQMSAGTNVPTCDTQKSLKNVSGYVIDDGRTETRITGNEDGKTIENTYSGTRPSEGGIVFRSYSTPDDSTVLAKLKVVYTNKVNTGKLTLKKTQEIGSEELSGNYKFQITFHNVGGMSLESSQITTTVTLRAGENKTIDGIPLGTEFSITEETPDDGSTLTKMTVDGKEQPLTNKQASGVITSADKEVVAEFTNAKKPVVSVSVKKLWKNSGGSDLSTEHIPDEIRVQLQRRIKGADGQPANDYSAVDGYSDIVISPGYVGWNDYIYKLDGLDKYVNYKVEEASKQEYEYRFVELDQNGNVIPSGGFLDHYQVTYSDSNQDSSSDNFSNTITNTLINKTNIKIIKRDASDEKILLGGVEFKLEKLKKEENETYVVDSTFNALTGTTSSEDGMKGQLQFNELEDGIYRLTETKAADNYSLLKEPITIVLDRVNGCKVDNAKWNVDENNTITLTISNRLKFELPATGGYGRTIMILGGLAVAGMALFMYRLQICRKGGRKSRKHL